MLSDLTHHLDDDYDILVVDSLIKDAYKMKCNKLIIFSGENFNNPAYEYISMHSIIVKLPYKFIFLKKIFIFIMFLLPKKLVNKRIINVTNLNNNVKKIFYTLITRKIVLELILII